MEDFLADLKYGARMLRKNPGFTAVAVLTLALGIGANTAIFSVVNGVLLKPLPYREPGQLFRVYQSSSGAPKFPISAGAFQDCREQNSTLSSLALYTREDLDLSKGGKPQRLAALRVTSGFFNVLGVQPHLGREFNRQDEVPANSHVAILSDRLWRRRFNADPAIVGSSVSLSGETYTVVGVMPPGFQHVGGEYRSMAYGESVDLWWPISLSTNDNRAWHYMNAIGRLKKGVSAEQAGADLKVISERLALQYPDTDQGWRITLQPLKEEIVGRSRMTLYVLFGAVAFVLLISCVNVANLLLVRAAARQGEIALRAAVGAGRRRIVRRLLTESLLLAAISSGVGIVLAIWGISTIRGVASEQLPRLQSVSLDGWVLLFTIVVALATGFLFGLVPAWQAGRIDLGKTLNEGGRGGSGSHQRSLRDLLVVTEVTAALVLLVGTGLLVRSFWALQRRDPGFTAQRVLTANLSLPNVRYGNGAKVVAFQQQLLERLASRPQVESVGMTSDLPWTGYDENAGFDIEGKSYPPNHGPGGRYHRVSAAYFRTVGVPLLAGRFFDTGDTDGKPRVILINRSLAERYWTGENAVGKRITFTSAPKTEDWFTVVGIVGDVNDSPNSAAATPAFYWPLSQMPSRDVTLAIRTRASLSETTEIVRDEVGMLDKDLALAGITPLEIIAGKAITGQRFTLLLFASFALTALLLAAIGIYGVLSYLMAQSAREFGVRMALGALKRDVMWLALKQGMRPTLVGIALGLEGAFALTRLMSSLLFGVSATDLRTFALSAVFMTIVALSACWLPSWRATRINPMEALRHE